MFKYIFLGMYLLQFSRQLFPQLTILKFYWPLTHSSTKAMKMQCYDYEWKSLIRNSQRQSQRWKSAPRHALMGPLLNNSYITANIGQRTYLFQRHFQLSRGRIAGFRVVLCKCTILTQQILTAVAWTAIKGWIL